MDRYDPDFEQQKNQNLSRKTKFVNISENVPKRQKGASVEDEILPGEHRHEIGPKFYTPGFSG